MTERLLMSPPDVGALEEQYVVAAIRSGWVAPAGPEVTAFEAEIAEVAGRRTRSRSPPAPLPSTWPCSASACDPATSSSWRR